MILSMTSLTKYIELHQIVDVFLPRLQFVEQSEKHHPEGNVLNHTLQVVRHAFRESQSFELILAALFHDIGKVKDKLLHHEIGADWLCGLCSDKTIWLVRNHMRIHKYLNGETKKLSKCSKLVNHPWFKDLVMLSRWDAMGRDVGKRVVYDSDQICQRLVSLTLKESQTNDAN